MTERESNRTIGIELCDAGLHTAQSGGANLELVEVAESGGAGWPAYLYHNGESFFFGGDAEAACLVDPPRVSHLFWDQLSHESSDLAGAGRTHSFSELAFFFLQDYWRRVTASTEPADGVVLAVPSAFLKDAATEETRIGLLLGMAGELGIPLSAIVDMACAAHSGPAIRELPAGAPIVHVDIHLEAAELSLLDHGERLLRRHYQHLPQLGHVAALRQLKSAMSNRFLRQTAFDIHENRLLEQAFYDQTRQFLLSRQAHAHEFIYQINTKRRTYQMTVARHVLAADLLPFVQSLSQSVTNMVQSVGESPRRCVVTLADRAARIDGLDTALRAAGFARILRLRPGAAALGSAALGQDRQPVADLADVPVELSVPAFGILDGVPVEAVWTFPESEHPRPAPTHLILDGIGHPLLGSELAIGTRRARSEVDVALPESFEVVGDYVLRLSREGRQFWLELPAAEANPAESTDPEPRRTPVSAGDRLTLRGCGRSVEMLFAHCGNAGDNGNSRG